MIRTLSLRNFKCLRETSIEFGAFTVLVGPNDSGKTSIYEAIDLLRRTFDEQRSLIFQADRSLESLSWQGGGAPVGWRVSVPGDGADSVYRLELPRTRAGSEDLFYRRPGDSEVHLVNEEGPDDFVIRGLGSSELRLSRVPADLTGLCSFRRNQAEAAALAPFLAELRSVTRLRLDPDALRKPSAPAIDSVLSSSGDNLAAVLDGLMTGGDRGAIPALEAELRRIVPSIHGVALRVSSQPPPGSKRIEVVLAEGQHRVPASQASDGVMLLLAFLTLAYSSDVRTLFVEEPENGLHPSVLGEVVDMLRRLSRGELGGRPRQIIVATHSPILLNFVEPEEVRIVVRRGDKGTKVYPMRGHEGELERDFGVGELLYLMGEEQLIAGAE